MTAEQAWSRIARLECLFLELAKERVTIAEAQDPLLYRERRGYLEALDDAIAGVESARVILAKARQRCRVLPPHPTPNTSES